MDHFTACHDQRIQDISFIHSLRTLEFVAVLLLAVTTVRGYNFFQTKIPNGELVPHPCKPNYLWKGVGHKNVEGGGAKNPFGEDFLDAGKIWTQALCERDSDNDGKTNGKELGDPNCVWTEGNAPEITVGLSHPGICDPFESEQCREQNKWVNCSLQEFKCDALERESAYDLMNITLKFTPTQVPAKETNYYCMTFDLNLTEEYHMIATEPVIDNAYVMHHIVLFGCQGEVPNMDIPRPCDMALQGCYHIIGIWTVGTFGECFHQEIGFLLGGSGFKKVAMQFHWNNPQLKSDYVDSSGMVLHLTKNRRTHNAGSLQVGQNYLQLSPGEDKIIVESSCTPDMSRARLRGPIHFTRGFNHMHYLGRAMSMEHFRNGVKLRDLTMDEVYSYDSPVVYNYADAIEFEPGDEIKTTCNFKTTDRSVTVWKGDGTNDEMCYGFLTYYPAENIMNPYCMQWRGLDSALFYYQDTINGCAWKNFFNMNIPETQRLHRQVLSHCSHLGLCLKECINIIKEVKRHPCLQGDMHEWIRNVVRTDATNNSALLQTALFLSAIDSCDTEIAIESCPTHVTDPTSASATVRLSDILIGATYMYVLNFIVYMNE